MKKGLSILLSLIMITTMFPINAIADEIIPVVMEYDEENKIQIEESKPNTIEEKTETAQSVSPKLSASKASLPDSGYCGGEGDGKNLEWYIKTESDYGTVYNYLVITGEGKMADYTYDENGITTAPWYDYLMYNSYPFVGHVYLRIEEGVTSIGDYAFMKLNKIENSLEIPDSVTHIGTSAFEGCYKINHDIIIMGSNVEYIGDYAFYDLYLNDPYADEGYDRFIFTGDAPEIGVNAFEKTATIVYPENNSTWNVVNNRWNGLAAYMPSERRASKYTDFYQWTLTHAGKLTVTKGDPREDSAWSIYRTSISELDLRYGITSIGDSAFATYYYILGDLNIPSSVTNIGTYAFYLCNFDGTLTLPWSVEKIGSHAFCKCDFTGELKLPYKITTIESFTFYGCNFTGELKIPYSVENIKDGAFAYCDNLSSLIIGDKVTNIGSDAFYGCEGLENIVLGNKVKTIGPYAFSYCTGVKSIIMPPSIEKIGKEAFLHSGINRIYFTGNAPAAEALSSFNLDAVIYYPEDNKTWEIIDGTWNRYTAIPWNTEAVYGDVNLDGIVDVKDVYLARLIAAKLVVPTEMESSFGDVDGDEKITAIDANLIRKFAVGIIDNFPVEV